MRDRQNLSKVVEGCTTKLSSGGGGEKQRKVFVGGGVDGG